jgi:hypothetical protein
MKFTLKVPVLLPEDELQIRIICNYYGYEPIIDHEKKKFFIVGNEDIAYIQKEKTLFIIWRRTEQIQKVSDLLDVTLSLERHDILPLETLSFKTAFINGLQSLLKWEKGTTLNEELQKCPK